PAAAVLDGGLDHWIAEGHLPTAEEPRVQPATFIARQPTPTASAGEIVEHLGDGAVTVIDARAPERYRGDVEPIDPVAGHIPGAVNRPSTPNLPDQGTFNPPV